MLLCLVVVYALACTRPPARLSNAACGMAMEAYSTSPGTSPGPIDGPSTMHAK